MLVVEGVGVRATKGSAMELVVSRGNSGRVRVLATLRGSVVGVGLGYGCLAGDAGVDCAEVLVEVRQAPSRKGSISRLACASCVCQGEAVVTAGNVPVAATGFPANGISNTGDLTITCFGYPNKEPVEVLGFYATVLGSNCKGSSLNRAVQVAQKRVGHRGAQCGSAIVQPAPKSREQT